MLTSTIRLIPFFLLCRFSPDAPDLVDNIGDFREVLGLGCFIFRVHQTPTLLLAHCKFCREAPQLFGVLSGFVYYLYYHLLHQTLLGMTLQTIQVTMVT